MIIKAKPFPILIVKWCMSFTNWYLTQIFNTLRVKGIQIQPDHSYLLMCNHFSFLDGLLAFYLSFRYINKNQKLKGIYIMIVKKQLEKNSWLRYFGCFSIQPGSRSVAESLSYASRILDEPGNLLLIYPQGNLESTHVRNIIFKDGLFDIISNTKGKCQLIWSSNLVEYFESMKPSIDFNMLDCGTNLEFDFELLKQKINSHHAKSIKSAFRFTEENDFCN